MIVQKIPRFESGNVLSKEMLETFNERYFVDDMKYMGYSNGILKGFDIRVADGYLVVGRGCYFFENQVYYIGMDVKIPYTHSDMVKILVIRNNDKEISRYFEIREADFKLISEEERLLTDIEICRFRVQQGAQLRYQMRNLKDMSTYYDTICLCYAQWSAYGGQSIAYPILEKYAYELMEFHNCQAEDRLMIGQILSSKGESISADYLKMYINHRVQRERDLDTPYDLYNGLCECIRVMSSDVPQRERSTFRERRIILD